MIQYFAVSSVMVPSEKMMKLRSFSACKKTRN